MWKHGFHPSGQGQQMNDARHENPPLFDFILQFQHGKRESLSCTLPCTVGRSLENQIRIRSWRVSKVHARFFQLAEGVYVEDFGSISGTCLNQIRISRAGPLRATDEIVIGSCKIRVSQSACIDDQHTGSSSHSSLSKIDQTPISPHSADHQNVNLYLVNPVQDSEKEHSHLPIQDKISYIHSNQDLFERLRLALFQHLDLRKQDITGMSGNDLRHFARQLMNGIAQVEFSEVQPEDMELLINSLLDEAFGFGLIEPLLSDPEVHEIMVNRFDQVFVERHGLLLPHPLRFSSESTLRTVIDRMLQSAGKRVDEGSPMADARLADGSRVNAVVPPIALHGASLTIRKFPERRISLEGMVKQQAMSQETCDDLKQAVLNKNSILISGGTGTGKTTLLNALMSAIPLTERLITIEDAAELRLPVTTNHVSLEARPSNAEGQGQITIRDLVRNALRMRPDRIVVGECRGPEALDMLSAMNTGHEGSMATLHANSPRDAISRLETLVLMGQNGLPSAAIREQIASAIDLIVQLKRMRSGRRVVSAIACITGIESGMLQLQTMFEHTGCD